MTSDYVRMTLPIQLMIRTTNIINKMIRII